MVIKGQLKIALENQEVTLNEGEVFIVPKGIPHKPIAEQECWILLFEPKQIKHTGEVESNLTKKMRNGFRIKYRCLHLEPDAESSYTNRSSTSITVPH